MCTVTWCAAGDGYELFMNRDELYSRGPAHPPTIRDRRGVRYIAPTDSDAGGTWIAANEHGLTVCLLNFYPRGHSAVERVYESRGGLVVALASLKDLADIDAHLSRIDLAVYRPFTVTAIDSTMNARLYRWYDGAGAGLRTVERPVPPISSSSFEPERVLRTRMETYAALVGDEPTVERLYAYHTSHMPEPGPYSVCMHRDDGASRSITRVAVAAGEVRMTYQAGPPHGTGEEHVVSTARR